MGIGLTMVLIAGSDFGPPKRLLLQCGDSRAVEVTCPPDSTVGDGSVVVEWGWQCSSGMVLLMIFWWKHNYLFMLVIKISDEILQNKKRTV